MKQSRDSKGRFLPKVKQKSWVELQEDQRSKYDLSKISENLFVIKTNYTIKDIEHAFYAGLNSKNSFYAPSKQWDFYKRDRGL